MSFASKLPDEHRQQYETIAAGWRAEQRLLEAEAALCNDAGDEQEMEAKTMPESRGRAVILPRLECFARITKGTHAERMDAR